MIGRIVASLLLLAPAGLGAQFSSDIPGVPRATIPARGTAQHRFEQEYSLARIDREPLDSIGVGLRFGVGRSWPIKDRFEVGYDVTLLDARVTRSPDSDPDSQYDDSFRALLTAVYGFRVGVKARPYSHTWPSGHTVEAAVGVSLQPAALAAYWLEDSEEGTWSGGLIQKHDEHGLVHRGGRTHRDLQWMLAVSHRASWVEGDVAIVHDSPDDYERSLLDVYRGASLRAGALLRLKQGLRAGLSWWGDGPPPWRDRLALPIGALERQPWGVLMRFGDPGDEVDLMVTSPTGEWTEAVSFYVRKR